MILASFARKESDKVCYAEGMRHSRELIRELYDQILQAVNKGGYEAHVKFLYFPSFQMRQIVLNELKREFKPKGYRVEFTKGDNDSEYTGVRVSW